MRHVATTALLAVAAVLATRVAASEPVDDAFTYQGKLTDNHAPADGLYDFSFTLHDVASGAGALVLGPVQVEDVPVENGVFSVRIDFGAGAFSGDQRWLEIGVRDHDATGVFETLQGRQELTAAPYALHALSGTPGPQGPSGVIQIVDFHNAMAEQAAAGANAPWAFAASAIVTVVAAQRVTAQAMGTFGSSSKGWASFLYAICRQPAGGGAITPLSGGSGSGHEVATPEPISVTASAVVATSGEYRIGLCTRNVGTFGIGLDVGNAEGWAMVTH